LVKIFSSISRPWLKSYTKSDLIFSMLCMSYFSNRNVWLHGYISRFEFQNMIFYASILAEVFRVVFFMITIFLNKIFVLIRSVGIFKGINFEKISHKSYIKINFLFIIRWEKKFNSISREVFFNKYCIFIRKKK
jgi:hypothetical protein